MVRVGFTSKGRGSPRWAAARAARPQVSAISSLVAMADRVTTAWCLLAGLGPSGVGGQLAELTEDLIEDLTESVAWRWSGFWGSA